MGKLGSVAAGQSKVVKIKILTQSVKRSLRVYGQTKILPKHKYEGLHQPSKTGIPFRNWPKFLGVGLECFMARASFWKRLWSHWPEQTQSKLNPARQQGLKLYIMLSSNF